VRLTAGYGGEHHQESLAGHCFKQPAAAHALLVDAVKSINALRHATGWDDMT
jgi:hypothetical protein